MVEDNLIQKTGRLRSVVFDHTTPVMQAVKGIKQEESEMFHRCLRLQYLTQVYYCSSPVSEAISASLVHADLIHSFCIFLVCLFSNSPKVSS